jgi:hypothetical protein
MADVPYKPEEQTLKRIEEQQRAEIQRELERKVGEAKPASGSLAFKPEPASENEKLKLAVADRNFKPAVEADRKVLQASDSLRAGEQRVVDRVNSTELIAWRPDARDRQVITSRVEKFWNNNREIEGLGVEASVRYLEKTGEYTDFVRLGKRNKPDVLCLAKDDKPCVVECKGHEVVAKDTGYIGTNGEKTGTLATENKDGIFFENEPQWLEKNRPYIENALQRKIEDPHVKPAEKVSCQRLSSALERTDFRDQSTYHRVAGAAGPEARFGNVGDYVTKVKPEKMIQTRMSV